MASKKQRRRREKGLRHDYEYVYVDDEGNEVEVDEEELAAAAPPKVRETRAGASNGRSKGTAKSQPQRRGAARKIDPPSWRRVGRRALIFAPLMLVTVTLLDRRGAFAGHVLQTLFLLAFFLPFSYVMDSIMYRSYVRRTGAAPDPKSAGKKR